MVEIGSTLLCLSFRDCFVHSMVCSGMCSWDVVAVGSIRLNREFSICLVVVVVSRSPGSVLEIDGPNMSYSNILR